MARTTYRLDAEPLGIGGFGIVYRGTHRITGRTAAVKVAHAGRVPHTRLRREIRVQKQLRHRHVMPIWDADPDDHWFAMPLALSTLARERAAARLNPTRLAAILLDICGALAYAHERDQLHRDVTPSNILLIGHGEDQRWVLSDWGLTKDIAGQQSLDLTQTGQVLGTRAFAPPEMFEAPSGAGPAVDVYYLGAIAGWALADAELVHGRVPSVSDLKWNNFIKLMTARDPERRSSLEHAIQLLRQLAGFQRNEPSGSTMDICSNCLNPVAGTRCTACGYYFAPYN